MYSPWLQTSLPVSRWLNFGVSLKVMHSFIHLFNQLNPNDNIFSKTHVQQGGLHNLPQLLNLLFASTNVTVGDVGLLLNLRYENTSVITLMDTWPIISTRTLPFLKFLKCLQMTVRGGSYLHHGDSWVDLGGQRDVDLVLVSVNTTCRQQGQRRW